MANDLDFDVGLGLNLEDSLTDIQKLEGELSKLFGMMKGAQKLLKQSVDSQTQDLKRALDAAVGNADQYARTFRRLQQAQTGVLSNASRGSQNQQVLESAANQIIAEMTKTESQMTAKIADAMVKAQARIFKNTNEAVVARLKKEMDSVELMVQRSTDSIRSAQMNRAAYTNQRLVSQYNDPEYLAAKQATDDYNRQRFMQRAQNIQQYNQPNVPAQPQGIFDKTFARFNENGGADILAVQARLMAGYQTLNLFYSAVRNGASFIVQLDSELKQFQAITATSATEMINFKVKLEDIATTSKFTAVELAKAATIMGQAGLSAREVGDSLQAVATLAAASGSDLAQAVDVVTSSISIFNLQTAQTADIANTMTAALNESKLTIDKIALGLQYAGNIASESGIGYKELIATLGALSNAGIKSGSTLGTGLRQLIIDIENPTEKFTATLKQLGLTQQDVSIKSKGLVGVLKTLQEAGFGTAQAFQSFEVRAASAFAAIDGNIDSITQMEESFRLSDAAIKANTVQMESLSNKWSRLGSNAGIALDKAFTPTLNVLKDILDFVSEIMKVLGQYPKILASIGTLIASVFSIIIVTQFSAAIRGLFIAIGGLVGALDAAKVSFIGLNLAMRANPWILIATVIGTAISLLYTWTSATNEATDSVDKMTASINELKGDVDATTQNLKALNEARQQLIDQQATLDNDPILRKAKILEVVDAFKELSLSVDSSKSSVTDLIAAIDKLSESQLKLKSTQLGLESNQTRGLISLYTSNLQNYRQGLFSGDQAANAPAGVRMLLSSMGNYDSVNSAQQSQMLREAYKKVIPDNLGFDNLFDVVGGNGKLPQNQDELARFIVQLHQVQEAMGEFRKKGTDDSNDIADSLGVLATAMEEVANRQRDIIAQQLKLGTLTKEQKQAGVMTSPGYVGLQSSATNLLSSVSTFNSTVMSGKSGLTDDQRLNKLKDFAVGLEAQIKTLSDKAISEGEDINGAFKQSILPSLSSALATLNTTIDEGAKGVIKSKEREFKRSDRLVSQQISALVRSTANANTADEVDIIEKSILTLLDSRRKAIQEEFAPKIKFAKDDTEKQDMLDALQEALDGVTAEERGYIEGITSRQNAIRDDFIRNQKKVLDDQIQALNTKIADNIEALKKLTPGPALDTLKKNILGMIEQLSRLMQESSNMNLQLNNPNMNFTSGPFAAAKTTASQQARMQQAMSILLGTGNYTQAQAAGLVGHLMAESGLDPTNNTGDGGLAYGIAQWHPDRQAGLMAWLQKNQLQNNLENQVRYVDQELRTKYPQIFANLQTATTVDEAVRKSAGYEGFKGYNTPTAPDSQVNYANRISYANAAMGVDASNIAKTDSLIQNTADAAKTAIDKSISMTADQSVKKLTEEMQTRVQQAKNSQDPDAILKMIDSVDDQYKKIIDTRTKEFNQVNPKATEADKADFQTNVIGAIQSDNLQKTSALIQEYWATVQQKGETAVKLAQMKLDEANKPENVNKYTADEIAKLQGDVNSAQNIARQQELVAATQMVTRAQTEAAAASQQYGAASEQVRFWSEQEAQAKQKVVDITNQKNAADAATAKQGPTVAQAIQSANEQWAIQAGLMQRTASGAMQMVPLATQVGNTWNQVLTGMSDNLATLFTNLASGTMSASDAMKQFALSTVQMFIQMIAKALAYQLVLSTLGKVGSDGGGLLTGLFGVPGSKNGEYIKGAALGEAVPTRDSVVRKVMPGEYILRRSAVKQIGRNNLDYLNSMGNRRMSNTPLADNADSKKQDNIVNVWVVSPDQQPQMGPNDIIAVVGDNISRRGALKQLIQQVNMGR